MRHGGRILSRYAGTYLRESTQLKCTVEAVPEVWRTAVSGAHQPRIRLANIYTPVEQCSYVYICRPSLAMELCRRDRATSADIRMQSSGNIREATSQARPSRQHAEHAVETLSEGTARTGQLRAGTFSGHRQEHSRWHRPPEVCG